jgi:hypothetical protein
MAASPSARASDRPERDPDGTPLQNNSWPETSAPAEPARRSRWRWIGGILALLLLIAAIAIRLIVARAEPILRTRVVETLSTRFKSRVELAAIHVYVANGVHVSGSGLEIYGATDPNPYEPGLQPILLIQEFEFSTPLRDLFREPMRVATVHVSGMTLNIPPAGNRSQITRMRKRSGKISIAVGEFDCENIKLLINTTKPDKAPLEFDISSLKMKEIGPGQPLHFNATLVNPKPVGDIQSSGQFGPFRELSPRDTPVQGNYTFSNADLSTIKGIGGILSSTGKYDGTLGRIVVDGETDTPDFRIAISGHSVPLHTDFHAIVDGTDGDTYLEPVKARVLQSSFTAKGKIVRVQDPHGHEIELDVVLDLARIQDLLQLGVKTDPPIMTGAVEMKTRLSLPPGVKDVAKRLKLAGTFRIPQAHFTNESVQSKIDSFSLRSQGKPKLAKEPHAEDVTTDLQGAFRLDDGLFNFSFLHFQIPGTHADMTGQYSLDGNTFDFHGTVKMEAKLSQMTTGWKSILLKPVDPFFRKNGAGTEVPFKITGTRSEPHFGLDFHHKEESKQEKEQESTDAR